MAMKFHGLPSRGSASRQSPGVVAAGGIAAGYVNPFISTHVEILWKALIAEFGRTVSYWLGDDETTQTDIVIVWVEGAEDEDVSPGRYSRAKIRNADLPRQPQRGDIVIKDGVQYDVVRVDAFAYYYCQVVLQDRTEQF